ncbi:MAG TPA: response regulator [Solirubrobacterales bacterium]|nr:response regulator [Solirubrobacterales bacterium]
MVDSVLVVDDDPAFLALAAQVLTGLGVTAVLTAGDAATALAVALAERPAAALVDVDLPDRDGFDLARQLERLPWGPRVVVTSTDREADRAIVPATNGPDLPFIAKEELAGCELRRRLLGE